MALTEVTIGTTSFHVDVIEAITKFDVDMSMSGNTEIDIDLADPGFRLLGANVFQRKQLLQWRDLKCEIAVVETSDRPSPQGLNVKCRSYAVQKFKRTKDAVVRSNISPTEWLTIEAKLIGATVIGQTSAKRPQIARVNTENEQQSTWDVMTSLASELGYEFFECAGVFYFGQPTWLAQRVTKWIINWPSDDDLDQIHVFGTPKCRSSENAKEAATVDLIIDRTVGVKLRPGDPVEFKGVPNFEGTYIVESVNFSDIQPNEPVALKLTTPIDPEAKNAKSTSSKKAVTELDGPTLALNQAALTAWEQEALV